MSFTHKIRPPLSGRSLLLCAYERVTISAAGIAVVAAVVAVSVAAITAYAEQENEDDDPAAVVTTKVEA